MRAHGLTQMVVETNQCHSEQTTNLGNAPETENNEIFFFQSHLLFERNLSLFPCFGDTNVAARGKAIIG